MILVFVNPRLSLLGLYHKLVISKSGIDKCIHKRSSQILTGRVNVGGGPSTCKIDVSLDISSSKLVYHSRVVSIWDL